MDVRSQRFVDVDGFGRLLPVIWAVYDEYLKSQLAL